VKDRNDSDHREVVATVRTISSWSVLEWPQWTWSHG